MNENYFAIFDSIPAGACVIDENFKIRCWNKQLSEWTGLATDETLEKDIREIFPHLAQTQYQSRFQAVLQGGAPAIFSSQFHKHLIPCPLDEKALRIQQTIVRSLKNFDQKFALIYVEDVTELSIRIQEAKKSRNRALEAARAKSDFMATMSHELRTPLNSIIGFSARLHRRLKESLTERDNDAFSSVSRNAKHLLQLINDILDLAKVEAGGIVITPQAMNLRLLAEEVVNQCAVPEKEQTISRQLEFAENVPQLIQADEVRIRQILINLFGNAMKFTESGKVTLRVSIQREEKDLFWVQFEVQDEGIGIPKDALEKIFLRFEQADSSTSRKFGGTGLGLAICKHLVQLMDGTIQVSSELGTGSNFCVRLPLQKLVKNEAA